MLIPTTSGWTLIALVISLICLGSWANTMKAAGKHRFELFYYDFSIGALISAVLMAISLGMMGNELTFEDNLAIAGKRSMAIGVLAGGLFNLGNMLLLAGVSISGMSVAYPIAFGLSTIIAIVWSYLAKEQGNPALIFGGVAVLLVSIVTNAIAHHSHALATKPKVKNRIGGGIKGISISIAAGVLLGLYLPLVEYSRVGDIGLGAYSALLFMAIGVFLTTFLYNLYFMNLPVQGEPVKFRQFFSAGKKSHLLGAAGGMIWAMGAGALLAAQSAPKAANVGQELMVPFSYGVPVLAALWGLFAWKEFAGATGRAKTLVPVMLVLYVAGLAMIAIGRGA